MSRTGLRRAATAALVAAAVIASASLAWAQFRGRGLGILGVRSTLAPDVFPDGDFVICRLVYSEARRFGAGWQTDHPLGERNLSIRFSELTRTRVSRAGDGSPSYYLVRATDDALFQCPFLMAGDPGSMGLTEPEAARLREYLLKGGFLWVDDMWGSTQWAAFTYELAKVFPPAEYPIVDVPLTDPIFSAQFIVEEMPQIPSIVYWRGSGDTSEQGADSAIPYFRAVRDDDGRIMVAITHNTDIADAFEREGEDPAFFYQFSPKGYALGINVLLHALTH
jgi:hypothetical protein